MQRGNFTGNLRDLPGHLNAKTVSAGLLAGIFGMTTSLIIISAGGEAGMPQDAVISWIFSVFFFGALTGLVLSVWYRQPIPGAWSIPGAALVAVSLSEYSIQEMAGAYFIAGLIVFAIGLSGLMDKVVRLIPLPIVLAMIVGVLMSFGVGMAKSLQASPLVAGTAILVFLLMHPFKDKIPPILPAFFAAAAAAAVTNQFRMEGGAAPFVLPRLVCPGFSGGAVVSVSIPLALLVVCGEMPKAIGVLMSQGYRPPVNAMTACCGLGGMIVSFFGGANVNIAGPMAAICSAPEAGGKDGRYAGVFVNALIFGAFGLAASAAVPFVAGLPPALISAVAGLAMVNVLLTSLQNAFKAGKFQTGAFFSLVISMSGVSFFGIAAPVWALAGGIFVSFLTEREDFAAERGSAER